MAKQEITDREEGEKMEKLPQGWYRGNATQDSIRVLMRKLNEIRRVYIKLCDDLKKRGVSLDEGIEEGYDEKIKSCMQDCAYLISCIEYTDIVNSLWPDFSNALRPRKETCYGQH